MYTQTILVQLSLNQKSLLQADQQGRVVVTLAFPVESAREILSCFETCCGALLSMVRCLQTFQLVVVLVV